MNYSVAILTSSFLFLSVFTFKTSTCVRFVFEVQNAFYKEKTIRLKSVTAASGHIRGEREVGPKESLTWELVKNWDTVSYLCHVTEIDEEGEDMYLGYFTAYDSAWLKDHTHRSLPSTKTITVKWLVFERGAITKLVPDLGGNQVSHHWLVLKFVVVSCFREEVIKLDVLRGDRSILKSGVVSPRENLNWTLFVTGKTQRFTYRCRASRVLPGRNQVLGTIDLLSSESVNHQRLEEFYTLEYWWAVNASGLGNYNPLKGRVSIKKRWT